MGYYGEFPGSLERVFTGSSSSYSTELRIGCLMCENAFHVDCEDGSARTAIQELTDGDIPVTQGDSRMAQKSMCGLGAVNGDCKRSDSMALLREMIETGEIEGARVNIRV